MASLLADGFLSVGGVKLDSDLVAHRSAGHE